jgi:hypothetical protein
MKKGILSDPYFMFTIFWRKAGNAIPIARFAVNKDETIILGRINKITLTQIINTRYLSFASLQLCFLNLAS